MPAEAGYRVVVTESGLACEHSARPREAVDWSDVIEISVVTTDAGPLAPDVWVLFAGAQGGCSMPQDAAGFDDLLEVYKQFEGFDYEAFIAAMSSAENARFVCWRRS